MSSIGTFVRVPATSEDDEPPSAPSNLSAIGGNGQISLSWTAATLPSASTATTR